MNLLIDLGLFNVDGDKWRNLVMAVFQVEVSAFSCLHGCSEQHVNLDNWQLTSDEKKKSVLPSALPLQLMRVRTKKSGTSTVATVLLTPKAPSSLTKKIVMPS